MTKKLFLATSPVVYEGNSHGNPHRTITRIVAAENDFQAVCLMEQHIREHELLMREERLDITEAHEAIGL